MMSRNSKLAISKSVGADVYLIDTKEMLWTSSSQENMEMQSKTESFGRKTAQMRV